MKNGPMIVLFWLYIEFGFLFLGAVGFCICLITPHTRRHAFAVALWFPVFGLSILADLTFAGLLAIVHSIAADQPQYKALTHLPMLRGSTAVLAFGLLLLSLTFASMVTVAHQWLARRMTFRFFRIYATAVSAGVGSTLGWALFAYQTMNMQNPSLVLSLAALLSLSLLLGWLGFRLARQLRGSAPMQFTWVTAEEFYGTPSLES